jgi:hypothetical protein
MDEFPEDGMHATRRSILVGGSVALAAATGGTAMAQTRSGSRKAVAEPVAGPYPHPSAARTAGPITAARGTALTGKVAVVTGAARGIGRKRAFRSTLLPEAVRPS